MFSHIADDGTDIVDDSWDVRNTYPPGTSHANSCRGWNGSLTPRSGVPPDAAVPLELLVFGKPARLVTWISAIDYADGTSWHAALQERGALAAAAIPNKIDYSHAVFGPATPDIAGSFLQQPASGIEITKSFTWNPGTPNECVQFINKSVKAVKRVALSSRISGATMHRSDKTNRRSFALAAEVTMQAYRRTEFAARSSERSCFRPTGTAAALSRRSCSIHGRRRFTCASMESTMPTAHRGPRPPLIEHVVWR